MPSPAEPKPKGGGWAAKFGFGSRKAKKTTPKIEKPKPVQNAYDPANTYSGRYGQIHDAVVITKPPPLVIRVIPNRPRVGDVPINQFEAPRPAPAPPVNSRLAPNSITLPEQSLTTYGRGEVDLNGQEVETPAWMRFNGAGHQGQVRSTPRQELVDEELDSMVLPPGLLAERRSRLRSSMAVEDRTTMPIDFYSRSRPNLLSGHRTIPAENRTILAVEDCTSTPIESHNRPRHNLRGGLRTMPAEHCAILAAEKRAILAAEERAILAAEERISMPTELHTNPQVEQPIPSIEPAPIHSRMPRGMRTDYLKTLWEHDLLRNPQSAPSVISVSTVDTYILDRPVSMAASFVSSETDDDESTVGSHSTPSAGASVLSIASVVTCIFNPVVAAVASSTLFVSDTMVSGINHEAGALMPSEDPVLVRKLGDKDDWLHSELYGFLDSIVVVKDRSSDACSDACSNAGSDAGSVYTENTPGCWIGDPGDWNSENYSLFQEDTPSECAGEVESQAMDNNFDQQIGIATTSPSDRFGPQVAFTESQNVLPVVDEGGAEALGGWPLQDNDHFEFPIEDGRSVHSFSPLIEQSPAYQNGSRPQAPKLALQTLEGPLDLVVNGQPTVRVTESLLPEIANQINSTVENGGSANLASPPLKAPRTPPGLVRWMRHLTGSRGAQHREARRARPRRWYLLRDRSDST